MSKYLRLTIDIKVENDEFAAALLEGEATVSDLAHNIDSEEIEIDAYYDVEDHS